VENNSTFYGHVFNSLSVLLPLSQFIVNERLWGSSIGVVAEGTTIFTPPKKSLPPPSAPPAPPAPPSAPPVRPDYTRPTKRKLTRRRNPYFTLESETDHVPLSNLINLSNSRCKKMWSRDAEVQALGAQESMASLHEKMRLFRNCYSTEGVERASLEIAAGLLAIAACPSCENLFMVLNQAANFASKGRKGGNNDRFFKGSLPRDRICTPREMLVVLGRADCLRAIGFVAEASFLVSFVAKECRSRRRDPTEWDIRWKLVAIYAYNISVMARTGKSSVFGEVYVWSRDVIEELNDARNEGLSIFGAVHMDIPPENDEDYVTEDEEEEERTRKKHKGKRAAENYDPDLADDEEEEEDPEISSDESDRETIEKRIAKHSRVSFVPTPPAEKPAVEKNNMPTTAVNAATESKHDSNSAFLPFEKASVFVDVPEPSNGWAEGAPGITEKHTPYTSSTDTNKIVEL